MVTIPSFSIPKTRQEFDNTRIFLTTYYETNESLSKNDASRIASQIITFKTQGLTNAQIQKNLEDDSAFRKEKEAERERELEELKNSEKARLIEKQVAEAKARSESLPPPRTSKERTAEEVRTLLDSQKDEPMVANPNNPRELIPKSQADKILQARRNVGKDTDQNSANQKNNPSVLETLKNLVTGQKDDSKAEVVAVNRSLVLLSNGKSVPRNEFTGEIPEKFLNTQRTKQPENNVTDIKDLERNKAAITNSQLTNIQSPIKTENTASISQDLSKVPDRKNSSGRRNDSVNQNDKPETTPVADAVKTIQDTVSGFIDSVTNPTPEAKAEGNKEEKLFDPLKDLSNFFGSLVGPKGETKTPEPTPEEKPKTPEPTPEEKPKTPEPTPEEKPKIEEPVSKTKRVIEFASKNSFAIAGTAISLMSLIAFLAVPRDVRTEIKRMR